MAALFGARGAQPTEVRFLAELDQAGQGKTAFDAQKRTAWKGNAIKEGIKVSANLNPIRLFFCRLFGMTVNIEIGNKTYACGRNSLEHFLRRHATEAQLSAKIGADGRKGQLSYEELAEGLRNLLANPQVQASIRSEVAQARSQNNLQDPRRQLYKDLGNAQQHNGRIEVLGAYGSNLRISQNDLRALMSGANIQPQQAPPVPLPPNSPPPRPIASPVKAEIPVTAVVTTIANATIAPGTGGPARQEAAIVIGLAQQNPAAVAEIVSAVDDPEPTVLPGTVEDVERAQRLHDSRTAVPTGLRQTELPHVQRGPERRAPSRPQPAAMPLPDAAARSPKEILEEQASKIEIDGADFEYCDDDWNIPTQKQLAVFDRALAILVTKGNSKWRNKWGKQSIARLSEQLPHVAFVARFKVNTSDANQQHLNAEFLNALRNIPNEQKPLLVKIAQDAFGKNSDEYRSFIETLLGTKTWS